MVELKESEKFLEKLTEKGFNTYYVSNQGAGKKEGTFTRSPSSMFGRYRWSYSEARDYLYKVSEILSHKDSERINIQYEHPELREIISAATTTTQRAGIQLVKSGAHGPLHRHTPNSFRVVLEAPDNNAFSRIDGVDLEMHPGDVIGNSNWIWHEHFNSGNSDLIWTSFLDAILVKWIGGVFYDPASDFSDDVNFPGISQEEYSDILGHSTLPADFESLPNTPLQYYPFAETSRSLHSLSKLKKNREHVAIKYINPTTGKSISANQSLKLNLLPPGCSTEFARKTENIIFLDFSGSCTIEFSDDSMSMEKFDLAAIPSWTRYRVLNQSQSTEMLYFTASDEPLFRNCGLYRELKG